MKLSKSNKKRKIYPKKVDADTVRNAIYTVKSFCFTYDKALQFINSGMLGFEIDEKGEHKLKEGKKIPITISQASYYKYREMYSELPEAYRYMREFAMRGYAVQAVGFLEELALLHRLSIENMLATKDPLERQQVIDSLVKNVIPTQSAFADILKELISDNKSITEETETATENDT